MHVGLLVMLSCGGMLPDVACANSSRGKYFRTSRTTMWVVNPVFARQFSGLPGC